MPMKFSTFLVLSCLIFPAPLYAGTMTLTTYYPAPSGNYNRIASNYVQLGESTLNGIKEEFKCSYDPAYGLPSCPAGLVFYNTDAHMLYVSDGTHWRSVNSSCVPIKQACSKTFNCGTDDCGNYCGTCIGSSTCSSSTPGIPGSCSS